MTTENQRDGRRRLAERRAAEAELADDLRGQNLVELARTQPARFLEYLDAGLVNGVPAPAADSEAGVAKAKNKTETMARLRNHLAIEDNQ